MYSSFFLFFLIMMAAMKEGGGLLSFYSFLIFRLDVSVSHGKEARLFTTQHSQSQTSYSTSWDTNDCHFYTVQRRNRLMFFRSPLISSTAVQSSPVHIPCIHLSVRPFVHHASKQAKQSLLLKNAKSQLNRAQAQALWHLSVQLCWHICNDV